MLYTKRQLLAILMNWTTDRTVPTVHRPILNVYIPPSMRSGGNTHARIEWTPEQSGAGDRLFRVTFWQSLDPRHAPIL